MEHMPMKVFISYSHKDKKYKEKITAHLSSLVRQKYIDIWCDSEIFAGEDIDIEIKKALLESQIILLIISDDYLNSYYCYEIELKKAFELYKENKIIIIPILARPVDLKGTLFDSLKTLPEDRRAVSKFSNPDYAYENIAKEIRKVVEARLSNKYEKPIDKEPKQQALTQINNYGIQFNGKTEIHGDINHYK